MPQLRALRADSHDVRYLTAVSVARSGKAVKRLAVVLSLTFALGVLPSAEPAEAGLLGGLLGTVTGLVGGVLTILTPGWDDDAKTPPVLLSTVADAIGADDLWRAGIDGAGVDVAQIDTGLVPVDGLTLPGKVVNGPDLSFDSQNVDARYLDGYGHGTHMAGIIGGNDGTATGFRGVAPGSRIVNVRVGSSDGAVDVSQVIAAIDWVIAHRHSDGLNIRVINLSFGTDSTQDRRFDPLANAVENAWRNGIVVVVGGGNDGTSRSILANPATNPYVIAVGAADLRATATAADDIVAPFSSRGSTARGVDVVAPGVSLASLRDPGSLIDEEHPSAVVNTRFFRGSGTSQAAAVTSGAAALLLQARPGLTPDQVKALLEVTATPLVKSDARSQGSGRINVALAATAPLPVSATQLWGYGTGTGLLERSRGTSHVADEGVELTGERDIMNQAWVGSSWAPASLAGTAWSDGTWNGAEWTDACWCSETWAGTGWTGRTWTGRTWTGRTWTGRTWTGRTWTGRTWTGRTWTNGSWNGRTWTGRTWTGRTWTSAPLSP
jgi:serine protease AprX